MYQINIPDYQYHLGCNAKGIVRLKFLEKSSYFIQKYRLIRLFFIQNYRNFIGSRSCPNLTKLGMEYSPHVYLESKTKRIFVIACLEKSSFFNRKNRLFYFAYSIFENIEILSDQGIVQI